MDSNKQKHLEFIQEAVKRMASNSFLLRGWSVTLLAALITVAVTNEKYVLLAVALGLLTMFWILDSYYLHLERQYRNLFDAVRGKSESAIDYDMDASPYASSYSAWSKAAKSTIFLIFYGLTSAVLVLWLLTVYVDISITLNIL